MTLNTSVAIGKPHNVREIFDFCRLLLNTPAGTPVETGPSNSERPWRKGQKWINNPCCVGLDAWLRLYYGADGPMSHTCDAICNADCIEATSDDPTENGWTAIEVTFDTAYGYRTDDGESCSDLHARLVRALGQWLDARGLPWKWQNEFTGEWFDRYEGLDTFGNAFRSTGAEDWFTNVVQPAIAAGRV